MKHKDFGDHELQCVNKWVRVIRDGIETHVLEDSEDKEQGGQFEFKYDARKNPIHKTTQEDINALLAYGYEVDYDILPAPKKKSRSTGDTDRSVYKQGCKWSGIDHRRAEGYLQESAELDGMNT